MGQVYRLDFETSQIRRLTSAPFYFTTNRFPRLPFPKRRYIPTSRFRQIAA